MRTFYAAFLLLFLALTAQAQLVTPDSTKPVAPAWRKWGKAGLGINESLLSDNWRGGGVNSIGFNALLNVKANRRVGPHSFDNQVDFLFAFSQTQGLGYRKAQDRLYLDTKYGHSLSAKWDMFLSLNLLTQFAKGYDYDKDSTGVERGSFVSDMFAPAFITAAYGLEYHTPYSFKLRLAPFAPRLTVVNRANRFVQALGDTPYGVNLGHSTRFEMLAAQILAEVDKNISPSVNVKARYVMFANYQELSWEMIDHRLDVSLTAKVSRYVNVALNGIVLYDHDQSSGVEYSQGLTIGVAYAFQNYQEEKK